MKSIKIIFSILIIFSVSCQQPTQKTEKQVIDENMTWVKKSFYEKSGALKTEITVKNKKKNGPAKEYYPSGNLRSLVNYVDNVTIGETIWYFENGQPYRVTPYVNGKMEGIRKIYYENGKLQAEIPYKNNQLIIGTKEYTQEGKLISSYPKIVFQTKNNIKTENKFILSCSLSKNSNNLKFSQEIINSENSISTISLPLINGVAQLVLYIPSLATIDKVITIYAEFTTSLGNPIKIMNTYHIKLETN